MLKRSVTRRLAAAIGAAGLVTTMAVTSAATAQAAVPDKWGFAFVDTPRVAGIPDLHHQAGAWPAGRHAHARPGVRGQVIVRFPNLAARAGVVHVTAVNKGPVGCQAQKWLPKGPDELVYVRCYKAKGFGSGRFVPVYSRFTVLFTTSSKGSIPAGAGYGYVHFQPGHGIVAKFNSSGRAITVRHPFAGHWTVIMAGLGSDVQAGGVQVTAVNGSVPVRCQLQDWTWRPAGQVFDIECILGHASPWDTGWTLSHQRETSITGARPDKFAYTFNNKTPQPGPYTPAPAGINFNSQSGLNTITGTERGLRAARLPLVAALPNTALVTPFRPLLGFCNLNGLWATQVPDVSARVGCFDARGVPANRAWLITYTTS